MTHPSYLPKRILPAIGLLSASTIAFQLALMHILSIVQWYHFAYMVISVALLGFGAAGTFLTIFKIRCLKKFELLFPILMILSGTAMTAATGISQLPFIKFDSYLLFADYSQFRNLLYTYMVFFVPFFLSALAIGLAFIRYVDHIGKLYFANLTGSGFGGIAALGLIWHLTPQTIPAVVGFLPVAAAIIALPKKSKSYVIGAALFSAITGMLLFNSPPRLILSEYKDLSKTLNLPDAQVILEKNSPFGLIQCVSSPALRFAPGLSLRYTSMAPVHKAVFRNGNWFGPVISWNSKDSNIVMDYTTNALPYAIGKRNSVLALDAGTGMDVAHAISKGAEKVIFVEPDPAVISLLKNELADETDSLLFHSAVMVKNTGSRAYLFTGASQFDLITLPTINTFGGTSGLNALQEQYILTKEAMKEMWLKLTENGVLCLTCWIDYPARNPLKLLATIVEVLYDQDIENPKEYIIAVRSWGTITFAVKRTPVTPDESEKSREFCRQMNFDPVLLPDIKHEERARYNALQDDLFFTCIDDILSSKRNSLYSEYDFYIKPAVDERPYFSQFLRWRSLPNLKEYFGQRTLPFIEIGYLIVILTFIQISLAAFILIILPLFSIGWNFLPIKLWTIFYFGGIGFGYMFVEIVLIQRLILYFGNPIYSAAAVISSMLICSGAGSYLSSRMNVKKHPQRLIYIIGITAALLILYAATLTSVLQRTISLAFTLKMTTAFLIIAPVSFCMGIPFPAGMSLLAGENNREIPWAWGINGCTSVIGAALATIIAVETGFAWVMICASVAYLLTLIANISLYKGLSRVRAL